MLVLAIDTALSAATVAVARDGVVLAARSSPMQRGHQEHIAPLTAEVLAEAGVSVRQLDRIGVTVGPGSFTGLRVGLAFAKGLAAAHNTPLIGIGVLAALAECEAGRAVAVIDAGRGAAYLQMFAGGTRVSAPSQLALEEARRVMVDHRPKRLIGPGATLFADIGGTEVIPIPSPSPDALTALTARGDLAPPAPLYLRAPDAKTIAERMAERQG